MVDGQWVLSIYIINNYYTLCSKVLVLYVYMYIFIIYMYVVGSTLVGTKTSDVSDK